MKLSLEPIPLKPDKTEEIFANEDCRNLLALWEEYYPKIGFHLPWIGYFVIDSESGKIVGCCAFTGKPVNHRVEVSYWTFSEYEGQGISTWSCAQLVSIARNADVGLTVFAKTAPECNASTKILQRNGFNFTGVVQDHEIGDAWEWTLKH